MADLNKFNDYVELNGVEKIINYLASYIIENDNICKLLKFNDINALSQTLTEDDRYSLIDSNIENKDNRRIYFQPYINKTIINERTELRIYPASFNIETRVLGKVYLAVDIIIHNNLWDLEDSRIRPLALLNELIISLNGSDVEGIGLLNIEGERIPLIPYNDYISGYRLILCTRVD